MNPALRERQDKALSLYQRICFLYVALSAVSLLASLLSLVSDGALGFCYSFLAYLRNAMFATVYGYGIAWNYAAYVVSVGLVTALTVYSGLMAAKAKVRWGVFAAAIYVADSLYCFIIAGGQSYPVLSAPEAYTAVGIHVLGLLAVTGAVVSYVRLYRLFKEGKK